MAEKPQLRIADQDHFPDDDPFAELTRIMGFDPRVPVQREAEPEAESEPGSLAGQGDGEDFGIDLEKELMGEFAAEDTGDASLHSVEPAAEYQPEMPRYEDEAVAYEAEPAAVDDEAEPAAVDDEAVAPADFDPAVEFEPAMPEASADDTHAFDNAFAASLENELSLDGEWVAAEDEAGTAEPEPYEAVADHTAAAQDDYPAAEYERAEPEYGQAEPLDHGSEAPSYQEQPAAEDYSQGNFVPESDWGSVDETAAAPQDDLADEFDAALAEVDMDFTAIPLGSAGRPEPHLEEEGQFHLQDVVEDVAPVADAGPSLEDELNALLGNMSAHQQQGAAPVAMEEDAPAIETEAEADDGQGDFDMALAADEFTAAAPAAVEPIEEVPAERAYARSNYRAEDLAYTTPVSDVAHVEGHAADIAQDAAADIDLGFDDEAFDAAFASSIEGEQPAYNGEPVAAEEPARADADPYSDLASLTAQFVPTGPVSSWREQSPQPEHYAAQYDEADYASSDDGQNAAPDYDDVPDIETIEVPEQAVALSDDLDIPEVAYEEEPTTAPVYDDIDAEFANLLNDMNSPEPSSAAPSNDAADETAPPADTHVEERADYVADFAYPAAAAAAGALGGAAAYGQGQAMAVRRDEFGGQDFAAEASSGGYRQPPVDDLDYDPDFDEEMALPAAYEQERRQPQRRGMLIAAIVGGVAILGGIGAFALSGGGADSQAPAVVKADDSPIKVRPENPGGAKVPNQDNQVYDAVSRTAGATAPQPQQEKLVTTAEEPVDVAAQVPEPAEPELAQDAEPDSPAPMAKSEDRIEQILDEGEIGAGADVPVVAPRKVRTMIVKADGTLVPREEPAPAVAAAPDTNATASDTMVDPAATTLSSESTAAVPTAPTETAAAPADAEPVPAEAGVAPNVAAAPQQSSATPNSVAVAPTRPSDQPVDVVGEVKADKVAALAPASAGGGWSMQIASQPSEAAAQASYQDLLRRYGSVLDGHQANIVKAEIAGKGTFWRVRVPAETRNDAIRLCESYKAAGGNCFVSR